MAYDLAFMVLFTIAVVMFITKNKHKVQNQGALNLYKTKLGLKIIESTAKKYKTILSRLEYFVIGLGYILMIAILGIMGYSTYLYIRYPIIVETIKAPPVIPLIPYFTEIFDLQSVFPPFYFTYFLVALIIVAVVHEFSHGIFARLNKIKIHTTGFAFMGPLIYSLISAWRSKSKNSRVNVSVATLIVIFAAVWLKSWLILIFLIVPLLGAFVEQDDKQMNKAKKKPQLAILAAGVFANMVFAFIFLILIWIFFVVAFTPTGILFNNYALDVIPRADILSVNNISLAQGISTLNFSEQYVKIETNYSHYFVQPISFNRSITSNAPYILVYRDSPAFRAKLSGIITAIDGKRVISFSNLGQILSEHKPGDSIEVSTLSRGKEVKTTLVLGESEQKRAFIGITSPDPSKASSIPGMMYAFTPKVDDALRGVHYESRLGDFGIFIFHMIWWIMTINFFVALFNMLPLGILDGGRFFYLTVVGITGSEKVGTRAFKIITWFIVALLAIMMVRWSFSIL